MKTKKKSLTIAKEFYIWDWKYRSGSIDELITSLNEAKKDGYTDIMFDINYGYYDDVSIECTVSGYREETDVEYQLRIKKELKKKIKKKKASLA